MKLNGFASKCHRFSWVVAILLLKFLGAFQTKPADPVIGGITQILRSQVIRQAEWAMKQDPETVTAHISSRSAGGPHDFFSEGDYWWLNPVSADSPHV